MNLNNLPLESQIPSYLISKKCQKEFEKTIHYWKVVLNIKNNNTQMTIKDRIDSFCSFYGSKLLSEKSFTVNWIIYLNDNKDFPLMALENINYSSDETIINQMIYSIFYNVFFLYVDFLSKPDVSRKSCTCFCNAISYFSYIDIFNSDAANIELIIQKVNNKSTVTLNRKKYELNPDIGTTILEEIPVSFTISPKYEFALLKINEYYSECISSSIIHSNSKYLGRNVPFNNYLSYLDGYSDFFMFLFSKRNLKTHLGLTYHYFLILNDVFEDYKKCGTFSFLNCIVKLAVYLITNTSFSQTLYDSLYLYHNISQQISFDDFLSSNIGYYKDDTLFPEKFCNYINEYGFMENISDLGSIYYNLITQCPSHSQKECCRNILEGFLNSIKEHSYDQTWIDRAYDEFIFKCLLPKCNEIDNSFPKYIHDDFRKQNIGHQWEKICVLIAENYSSDNSIPVHIHPRLSTNYVPDIAFGEIKNNIYPKLIEYKKSLYFMRSIINEEYLLQLSKDFQHYVDHCEKLEFWILDGEYEKDQIYGLVNNPKVSLLFPEDIIRKYHVSKSIKSDIAHLKEYSSLDDNEYKKYWCKSHDIFNKMNRLFQP